MATPAPPDAADAPPRCGTLKRRADFLRAARALKQGTPGFLVQGRRRPAGGAPDPAIRVGFTCSRKLGNAVTRNRAKRRLRAAAATILPAAGRPGWDYVLVGRPGATVARPFDALLDDLRGALDRLHRTADRAADPTKDRSPRVPAGTPPTRASDPATTTRTHSAPIDEGGR